MVTALNINAWDQLGSSIVGAVIGGVLGGITVLIGVHLGGKQEEERHRREELDRVTEQRRRRANLLMLSVHNLRDELAESRDGLTGDVRLYPLREQLLLAEAALGGLPSLTAVQEFYDAAAAYRSWTRDHPSEDRDDATVQAVEQFRKQYARYADRVITLLQRQHDDPGASIDGRAVLPTLPL